MAPSISLFEKAKNKMFEAYSKDAGKMLLHTATLGWIFSAAGQIFGIATNDKVSKKQKKFLIPQEIADAGINIISFYTLTACIQNGAKRLASSGKIITPAIKKFCLEHGIKLEKGKDVKALDIGKALLDKVKQYQSTIDSNSELDLKLALSDDKINLLKQKRDEINAFYDKTYSPFESGVKVVGNVIGAVVSSNIVTPLLRNPIAAYKQKQDMAREELKENNVKPVHKIVMGSRTELPAYNNRSNTAIYPSSSSMKI